MDTYEEFIQRIKDTAEELQVDMHMAEAFVLNYYKARLERDQYETIWNSKEDL